jgi:hypothetical protein
MIIGASSIVAPVSADDAISFGVQKSNEGDSKGDNSSYFDLTVKPGDELTLETNIFSKSKKAIVVDSKIFTAYTNSNGIIDYTSKAKKYDKSLKTKLSDIAEIHASDLKAEVQPEQRRTVKADIKVPDTAPDGVILGSWYFTLAEDEKDAETKGISNRYAYSIGIKLTVNQEIDKPNLNLTSVTTGVHDYQKAFFANFQNDQRAILSNLEITAKVTKRGSYDVLYENHTEGVSMAPNSNYAYPVKLGKDLMKPGEYTMRVKATTTDPKWAEKTWTWDMDFTVLKKDVDEANKAAIRDPKPNPFPWLLLIIVVAIALLLIFFIFLLWKRRKKKEEEEKKNENK